MIQVGDLCFDIQESKNMRRLPDDAQGRTTFMEVDSGHIRIRPLSKMRKIEEQLITVEIKPEVIKTIVLHATNVVHAINRTLDEDLRLTVENIEMLEKKLADANEVLFTFLKVG